MNNHRDISPKCVLHAPTQAYRNHIRTSFCPYVTVRQPQLRRK